MSDSSLKAKIELWRHAWEGDDPNSIKSQILNLIWNAGIFGFINECRRPNEDGSAPELNGPIQAFIDNNFVACQMARMRRLVDGYPLEAIKNGARDKSVFSLSSLVADIEKHRHLMTRKAIFLLQDLEYDLAFAQQRESEEFQREIESGSSTMFFSTAAWHSRDLHQLWDRLSGVSATERDEGDIPRKEIFERMNSDLREVDQARDWATLFIAHAASTSSREASGKGETPTWNRIHEMAASIVRVASAISELVFQAHMASWLPVPQYDLFKNIDRPWCDEKRLGEVRSWWSEFEKRVESWPNTGKYIESQTCS